MKGERMKVRVTSIWDKSIVFSSYGVRSFGKEACEVDSPTPELPWEGDVINRIVSSVSNIHMASRTHETGYLSQLASSLITSPVLRKYALQQT